MHTHKHELEHTHADYIMLGEGSTFHFTIASNMRIARQHQASHDMQEELHKKRMLEVQRSFAGKTAVVLVKVHLNFLMINNKYFFSLSF